MSDNDLRNAIDKGIEAGKKRCGEDGLFGRLDSYATDWVDEEIAEKCGPHLDRLRREIEKEIGRRAARESIHPRFVAMLSEILTVAVVSRCVAEGENPEEVFNLGIGWSAEMLRVELNSFTNDKPLRKKNDAEDNQRQRYP